MEDFTKEGLGTEESKMPREPSPFSLHAYAKWWVEDGVKGGH